MTIEKFLRKNYVKFIWKFYRSSSENFEGIHQTTIDKNLKKFQEINEETVEVDLIFP